VIADASVIVAMHAVERFDDRSDLDVEIGFFLDLTADGVGQ